jgi:hypothetical protein
VLTEPAVAGLQNRRFGNGEKVGKTAAALYRRDHGRVPCWASPRLRRDDCRSSRLLVEESRTYSQRARVLLYNHILARLGGVAKGRHDSRWPFVKESPDLMTILGFRMINVSKTGGKMTGSWCCFFVRGAMMLYWPVTSMLRGGLYDTPRPAYHTAH